MKNTCILLLATLLSFGSCTQPPTSTANVPIKELYRAKHDDVTIRKHPRSRAFVYRKLRSGSTVYVYNQACTDTQPLFGIAQSVQSSEVTRLAGNQKYFKSIRHRQTLIDG